MNEVVKRISEEHQKRRLPEFNVGDAVRVHVLITEGKKDRIQVFAGTCIAKSGGGISESFTVRRVAYGQGVERIFPIHSPRVTKVEVETHGDVRRAKLYYLRDKIGKAARVKTKLRAKAKPGQAKPGKA